MIIYMTDEQRKKLAVYLSAYRAELSRLDNYRKISWAELAKPLGLSGSMLDKLSKGEKKGLNYESALKLRRGFGIQVFKILGLDLDAPPLYKTERPIE